MPGTNEDAGSSWVHVGPGYLETIGQKIIRGRSITQDDTASTRNVAVVDEIFVRRFFKPEEDPIRAHFGPDLPQYSGTFEIDGVSKEANYTDRTGHWRRPLFFVPLAQRVHYDDPIMQCLDDAGHYVGNAILKVHGNVVEGLESQVRHVLSDFDPNLTLRRIQTMQGNVELSAVTQLTGLFGILALVLAAVGLYGVTAYAIKRRTSEIGVRMAFGADHGNVVALVLRGAFLQVLIGRLIGIPITSSCSKLIANQLYYVKGWDPMVLGGAIFALAACAFFASIIAARWAASINPMQALRTE